MSQITEEFKEKIDALSCEQLSGVIAILGVKACDVSTAYDIAEVLDVNPRLRNPDPIIFDKKISRIARTVNEDKFQYAKYIFYKKGCINEATKREL